VEEGYEATKEIKKKYELERLTAHHRLIVKILKQCKGISSSDFYEIYKWVAKKRGLNVKSRRSFNNYLTDLIELNCVKVERARVRGNVRLFRAT